MIFADFGQHLELGRVEQPRGNLHAYHVDAGLALAVDAVVQTEVLEMLFQYFSPLQTLDLYLEDLDLPLDLRRESLLARRGR